MLTHTTSNYVLGSLSYLIPQAEKPFNFMYEPSPGALRQNCQYRQHACAIQSARPIADSISLAGQGFELLHAPTGMSDFYDQIAIADTYFPQVEELACAITGGTRAVVFDHKLRMREQGRPPLTFGRHGDGETPGAVGHVHVDYTETSGKQRLGLTLPTMAADRPFMILGFWRPILHPVFDAPLALCDARTVASEHLVPTDIIYPRRSGEIYLATFSDTHRWYYYPEMEPNEVLIFKHYDSRKDESARRVAHCAFDTPVSADVPLRRSIEVRCLVLLD
jgi:hypothetical protein